MALNLDFEGGDTSKNVTLKQRISKINRLLSDLKQKLYVERRMLEQQKREMKEKGWSISESLRPSIKSGTIAASTESTVTLNKTRLKEIKQTCEVELGKLDDFIFNVSQLKDNWLKLRKEKEKRNNEIEKHGTTTTLEKKAPKGKVFYVDSNLYQTY